MESSGRVAVIAVGVAALAGAFVAGRYSSPATRTEFVQGVDHTVAVKTIVYVRSTDTKTVWKTVTHRDGTTESTGSTETHEVASSGETAKTEAVHETTTKVQTTNAPRVTILGLAGLQMTGSLKAGLSFAPTFGAAVSYRVVGPVTVHVFGLTNGTLGIGAGLQF